MERVSKALFVAVFLRVFLIPDIAASAPPAPAETGVTENSSDRFSRWIERTWLAADGLLSDTVTTIARTSDGFLWVGTPRGLMRFDGVRMMPVRDRLMPQHSTSRVTALLADGTGKLWVALDGGELLQFAPFAHGHQITNAIKLAKPALSLATDAAGNVWCGHLGGWSRVNSAGKLADATTSDFDGDPDARHEFLRLANGEVWRNVAGEITRATAGGFHPVTRFDASTTLAPRREGGVWFTREGVLAVLLPDGEINCHAQLDLTRTEAVNALADDGNGGAWIATADHGMMHFDGATLRRASRSDAGVSCLLIDESHNLWFGGRGSGLTRLRNRQFQTIGTRAGLPRIRPTSLCRDTTGTLWIGTFNSPVVRHHNGVVESFPKNAGDIPRSVIAMAPGPGGVMWLGAETNRLHFWNGTSFEEVSSPTGTIRTMLVTSDDSLWVGSLNRGLFRRRDGEWIHYRPRDGAPASGVTALCEGLDRTLWIGLADGALVRMEQGRFERFATQDSITGRPITAILPRPDGSVLAASNGGGLVGWRRGVTRRIQQLGGLRSNFLVDLRADASGRLWAASTHGLFSVPLSELDEFFAGKRQRVETVNYGRDDGLAVDEFFASRFAMPPRSPEIAFASGGGVVIFQPDKILPRRPVAPVLIERLRVDGTLVHGQEGMKIILSESLRIPSGSDRIEVDFTAPELEAPDRLKFVHRIEGWQSGWQDAPASRRIVLGRLPPGKYQLQIRARGPDGLWDTRNASLPLAVIPPFWQTGTFIALSCAGMLGVVTLGVWAVMAHRLRLKTQRIQREEAVLLERERIARDLHDDVGANLTRLALLCELTAQQTDPRFSTRKIPEMARLARATISSMDEVIWMMNPANDSLARMVGFLSRWANDFLTRTGVTLQEDLPEELPDISLSSEQRHCLLMAVKEAISNALKHSGSTRIDLCIRVEDFVLSIRVADYGCGFDTESQSSGHGLGNLATRLQHVGGCAQVVSIPGQGTAVEINLDLRPLQPLEPHDDISHHRSSGR